MELTKISVSPALIKLVQFLAHLLFEEKKVKVAIIVHCVCLQKFYDFTCNRWALATICSDLVFKPVLKNILVCDHFFFHWVAGDRQLTACSVQQLLMLTTFTTHLFTVKTWCLLILNQLPLQFMYGLCFEKNRRIHKDLLCINFLLVQSFVVKIEKHEQWES